MTDTLANGYTTDTLADGYVTDTLADGYVTDSPPAPSHAITRL